MKYIKLLMLMAVVSLFTACSDDNSFNTNDVTVGFDAASQEYLESAGLVKVPIKVTGERNGDIKVKVEAVGSSAKENEHFIMTSGDLNIPAANEEGVVYVEIRIIDDGDLENDDREFTLNITDAQGAKVDVSSAKVILKDVDKNPYFKLFGTYEVSAIDLETSTPITYEVTIDDNQTPEFSEKMLCVWGNPDSWYGFETCMLLEYKPDGTLKFSTEGMWDGLYNFGSFLGAVSILPYTISGSRLVPCNDGEGPKAKYNDTYDTIEFVETCYMTTAVWSYNSGFEAYKDYYDDPIWVIKMTKKN